MPYYDEQTIATVEEALQQLTVSDLKQLAALLPTSNKPTRKAELVEFVKSHLTIENLRKLWGQLDRLQQAAVAETVHETDGHFDAARFYAKYREAPNWGTADKYGYNRQPSLLCLFIYGVIIPDDLLQRLKVFVAPPNEVQIETFDKCPEVYRVQWREWNWDTGKREIHEKDVPVKPYEMETAAQQDLLAVLRLINAGKVSVSDLTRYPSTATMQAIASILTGGDYYNDAEIPDEDEKTGLIKPFAWAMLVQAAGLAEQACKKLALTKTGQKALTAPPAQTIRQIWKKWLKNKLLDEMRRIDNIKGVVTVT